MPLPKTTKGITTQPEECQFLLYGPPGIGKSQAASTFPNVCFLSTTRGLGHLDVAEQTIANWEDFQETCADIAEGGHGYKTFCIDLLRDLYDFCINYVSAEELGGKHPSDFDWGKGWGAVGKEFRRCLAKVMDCGYTVKGQKVHYGWVYIAHVDTKEIKAKGFKLDKLVPRLTDSTFTWLFGIIDFLIYMEMERVRDNEDGIVERRVMHAGPSTDYESKSWIRDVPRHIVFEDENFYELVTQHLFANKKVVKKNVNKK